jgi:tetratricopeptide (TPR) repeat protein
MRGSPRGWILGTVLAVGLAFAVGPAHADQNDPRLPDLFDMLHDAAPNSPEAHAAQREIWGAWIEAPTAGGRVLMRQGMDQMRVGDFGAAIETFTALIALEPDFAEAWNKRATVYFMVGLYPESLADIDSTLDLEPRHFGAQSGQGMVYDALEEPEAALEAFEKALDLNPHMTQVRVRIDQLRAEIEGTQL